MQGTATALSTDWLQAGSPTNDTLKQLVGPRMLWMVRGIVPLAPCCTASASDVLFQAISLPASRESISSSRQYFISGTVAHGWPCTPGADPEAGAHRAAAACPARSSCLLRLLKRLVVLLFRVITYTRRPSLSCARLS
jgi:hypothetical protein